MSDKSWDFSLACGSSSPEARELVPKRGAREMARAAARTGRWRMRAESEQIRSSSASGAWLSLRPSQSHESDRCDRVRMFEEASRLTIDLMLHNQANWWASGFGAGLDSARGGR